MFANFKNNITTSESFLSTSAGIFSCIIWSASVAVSGILADSLGPLTGAGFELLIGGVAFLLIQKRPGSFKSMWTHPIRYYLICGSLWGINMVTFWLAVGNVTSKDHLLVVGLLNYLWPSLTFAISIFLFQKRWSKLITLGLILALLGTFTTRLALQSDTLTEFLRHLSSEPNLLAYLFAIIDAFAWALYSNLSRIYANPKSGNAIPLFMIFLGPPLIVMGTFELEPQIFTLGITLLLLAWSIISASAYLLWDIGIRKGNISTISAISMLLPLLSTFWTLSLKQIPFNITVIIGSLIVILGSWLCKKGSQLPPG